MGTTSAKAFLLASLATSGCSLPAPPDSAEQELPPRFPGTDLYLEAGLKEEGGLTFVEAVLAMFPSEPSAECARSVSGFDAFLEGEPLARETAVDTVFELLGCNWVGGAPECGELVDATTRASIINSLCPTTVFHGRAPSARGVVDFDVEMRSGEESITFHVGPVSSATANAPNTATAGERLQVHGIPMGNGPTDAHVTPLGGNVDDASPDSWPVALHSGGAGGLMRIPAHIEGDYELVFHYAVDADIARCEFHQCLSDVRMYSTPHLLTVLPAPTDAGAESRAP